MTVLAPSTELAAERARWEDPFDESGDYRRLAALLAAAPVGTQVPGEYMPALTVAEKTYTGVTGRWVRLTGDGLPAQPTIWCRCQPPPDDWTYYETWTERLGRQAHGWVHTDPACRRLVQSG
jgi:hypothetical protein